MSLKKYIDEINPFNFLSYQIPACNLLISKRQAQKRLYNALIRQSQNKIYAFVLNQRIRNAEIEALNQKRAENLKKANEMDEAIIEKKKLPKIDIDEIIKEQKQANQLRKEAGKLPRDKEDFNKDGGILWNTIPEMIQGQELNIQSNLQEITKNQKTIEFIKEQRAKL